MNQASSFPAYDEVLYESAHHMLDKFYWAVTGLKGCILHAMPVSVWMDRGQLKNEE